MRTIMFRGKVEYPPKYIGKKDVANGEWVCGELHLQCRNPHIHKDMLTTYPININTIGQFTGICDKGGKKIYEGDVVSIGDHESVAVVIWHEHLCQFCYEFYKDKPQRRSDQKATLIDMMNEYDINVIGNIHDNPKLVPRWEL